MGEHFVRQPASNLSAVTSDRLDLVLKEEVFTEVWLLQFSNTKDVDDFSKALSYHKLEVGQWSEIEKISYLRFGPTSLNVVFDEQTLFVLNKAFKGCKTDISHGKSLFSLKGKNSLDFLQDYSISNLSGLYTEDRVLVKSNIIDYPTMLWRKESDCMNLLIDRSYAQSFIEFYQSLVLRRNV